MALGDAILACLTERPMTGYELAKTFDSSIGFFWRASHQQIYRELQQLRAQRLVDSKDVIQTERPNKTVYTITKKGLDHVRAWSRELSDRPPVRDNMLLKLYASLGVSASVAAPALAGLQHAAPRQASDSLLSVDRSAPAPSPRTYPWGSGRDRSGGGPETCCP